jgi:hypothetical protein
MVSLCATVGMVGGGYVPALWGASAFSGTALLLSVAGALAGVWVGVRLIDF